MANPRIEHFDIFEENVRLGNIGEEPIDECPPALFDEYQKAMASLSPELRDQVLKASKIIKESAFPRRIITVDSSSSGTSYNQLNGMNEALNNGIDSTSWMQSINPYSATPRSSSVLMGGAQMQSPIIYEKPKDGLAKWLANKIRKMIE